MTAGLHSFLAWTPAELSVIAESNLVPPQVRAESGFMLIRFEGPLDFALTGVLASVAGPLAAARISIVAVSTFDQDYVLVRAGVIDAAADVLRAAGHTVGWLDRA